MSSPAPEMMLALKTDRTKVVMAKAASPSGPGSAMAPVLTLSRSSLESRLWLSSSGEPTTRGVSTVVIEVLSERVPRDAAWVMRVTVVCV